MNAHDRAGHAVGDARKRIIDADLPNHDEQHAHLHEWPDDAPDDN